MIDWAGDIFTGMNPDDVLADIGSAQWQPTKDIRKVLATRIWNADAVIINDRLAAGPFLRELERLGYITIITRT